MQPTTANGSASRRGRCRARQSSDTNIAVGPRSHQRGAWLLQRWPFGRIPELAGSARPPSSRLADAAVGQCIAKAVLTWQFPKPTGGRNVRRHVSVHVGPGRAMMPGWMLALIG
jgi:hypothetical protein